ncbi:MAG: hypothetical protein HQL20_03115 [Candidatus Omnitrophica bacterium]|nr:hypothetical protein [Candidatus Omnitrophota bacterium]
MRKNNERLFVGVVCGLFLIKILGKILHASVRVEWASFLNPALVADLVSVVFVYSALLILACQWSRILAIPTSFIFLIIPFVLYFMLLLNSLYFHIADQTVLWAALGLFIIGAWFWGRGSVAKTSATPGTPKDVWAYLLVMVFVIQGAMLFLSLNFRVERVPFADEGSFWFIAAREMLAKGFLAAHQGGYPGGGLHPFGVPFLNALPGLLVNSNSAASLFFMPVYIIVGLTLVLLEFVSAQRSKWGLVFFLVAWFAAFNNRSWSGSLFYSMVYGESVCMVLVVSLLSWLMLQTRGVIGRSWLVMAFLLGLLALTKFPMILLSVGFFIAFLMLGWNGIKGSGKLLLMAAIFTVPFLVFKLFQMKYGGVISSVGAMSLERLFLPNMDMLWRVVDNIRVDAGNLWYYFLVSVGVLCFSPKQWVYAWPIFLWVLFLSFYYAYLYAYGTIGGGDAVSGLRYFLPAVAGAFFLGAKGVGRLFDAIQRQENRWVRLGLYMVGIGIIVYKLF